ncbi:DNA polymerase III chi subunit [Breoghania corrubedonensis]|uniref:DNA polymerase III chi subunit n=1 Tax=Breoghania corrubedonensis TaxID=665038 RepID=A0A2T5V9M7_9HYPH|nr:DNA polymerase III chi subunit [Breoghania corrubedonensis]
MLFYHLQRRTLESVIGDLLEKSLDRGWRVVVQSGSTERRDALDGYLWTYREDAFLPHGTASDGREADQPVYLTDGLENPNQANVRFLVDRAVPPDLSPYERGVYIFDGNDEQSVVDARLRWKEARSAGHAVTYWQENESGGFSKKA